MNKTAKQSPMFNKLMERYLKGYITDSQLDRYVSLGQLTEIEKEVIKLEKKYQDGELERPVALPE